VRRFNLTNQAAFAYMHAKCVKEWWKMESSESKCAHQGCSCKVPAGKRYCSDHCSNAQAAGKVGSSCACGHPACRR